MKKITLLILLLFTFESMLFSYSEECIDAKEQAENNQDDLLNYTHNFYSCVDGNNLTDDCNSEFRRVKSAQDDFEDAVSRVNSECE